MEKLQVLEMLIKLFGGEKNPTEPSALLADLPPEAKSGPKLDANGNPLRTWDAEFTGYDAAYVIAAAIERLGADGWVDCMLYGEPKPAYISRQARESGAPDAVEIDGECVMYFPGLRTARFSSATAVARNVGDAKKACQTTCRKRALASIGIGWRGYTDSREVQGRQIDNSETPAPVLEVHEKAAGAPSPAPSPAPQPASKPKASPNKPITEAQSRMIQKLFQERGVTPEAWRQYSGGRKLAELNAAEASAIIDGFLRGTHELLATAEAALPDGNPYGGVK